MIKLIDKLINDKFKKMLISNTLTSIVVIIIITLISSALSEHSGIAYYTMIISVGILCVIAIIYIVFSWLVNPVIKIFKKIIKK